MPNPNQRLQQSFQARRTERDRRIRAIGRQFDPLTRKLEERLLGIVAANRGGQDGVLGSVDVVLIGMIPDLAAAVEKGLRSLWLWSWRSATRTIIRALPLRFWAARHIGVKTLVTEGHGTTLLEDEPPEYKFGPEDQLLRIIQGKVSTEEAREIVRQLEFPPLSEEQVSRIIDATEAHDGMSAMQRIRTVESGRIGELRDLIIEGYSHVDGVSGIDWLTPRLKDLVGGINYRAKRIARTEGVRIAEAGLRESWDNCTDLMDGVQWFSARVPRSRPDHVARHNKIYRRTSGGWIADDGESLPPIPLGPNCLCWSSPVLADDLIRGLPDADYGTYDAAKARYKQEKAEIEKEKVKRKPKAKPTPKPAVAPKAKIPEKPFPGASVIRKWDKHSVKPLESQVDELSAEAQQAVKKYTGLAKTDYVQLNSGLRQGKSLSGVAADIQKAIESEGALPAGTTVWRGVGVPDWDKEAFVKRFAQAAKSGKPVQLKGLISTTADPRVVQKFTSESQLAFEIRPKKGLYVQPMSKYKREQEVILRHGSRYKVAGVQEDVSLGKSQGKGWGVTLIQLEEI